MILFNGLSNIGPVLSDSGFETSIIYEGGTFRMYHTELYYDGAKPPNPGYPWNWGRINYRTSADGVTWSSATECTAMNQYTRGRVFKHPSDGYYYWAGSKFAVWTGVDVFRSATGNPDDWTLFQSNAVALGSGWESSQMGNARLYFEGSTWYLFYEAYNGSIWQIGVASGAALSSLSKYGSNPIFTNSISGAVCGGLGDIFKINGRYYALSHASDISGVTPTMIVGWSSDSLLSTWRFDNYALKINSTYGAATAQFADPTMVVVSGTTYVFYEAMSDQADFGDISLATFTGDEEAFFSYTDGYRGDDLPAEGWVFDASYGEVRSGGAYPTTYFRKVPSPVSSAPLSVVCVTDATHSIRVRKSVSCVGSAPSVDVDIRAAQTNKNVKIQLLNLTTVLRSIRLADDGDYYIDSGAGEVSQGAYSADTWYTATFSFSGTAIRPTHIYFEQDAGATGYIGRIEGAAFTDASPRKTAER